MPEINQLRSEMDYVTFEIIKLFKTRIDIAKKIGNLKNTLGIKITDEEREDNLRSKVILLCKNIDLDHSVATKLLNFLLCESIKTQISNKQPESIFLKAKNLELHGKKIIHMEVGEPHFPPPFNVKNALCEIYDKGITKYDQAEGMLELRLAIAKKIFEQYDNNITKENIIICPGARFAVYLVIATILKPGDEIIIIDPSWSAYKDCALNFGIKTRIIRTDMKNNWEPDILQINDAVNTNTKMIVLNYPNNPTGKILHEQLQDEIINLSIKNDLYILSDETYSYYTYTAWKSVLSYNYKKSIVIKSFSKSHAMTGFRIGYSIADHKVISMMVKLQSLCLTNVSSPIQYAALKALDADITSNINTIKSQLNIVIKKAESIGLKFIKPSGAMYIFIQVDKNSNFDSMRLSDVLLNNGLAVLPGEKFGNYKNFIRVSVCQNKQQLIEGMDILNDVLKEKL